MERGRHDNGMNIIQSAYLFLSAVLLFSGCENNGAVHEGSNGEHQKEMENEETRIRLKRLREKEQRELQKLKKDYEQARKNARYIYETQERDTRLQATLRKIDIAGKLGIDTRANERQRQNVERQFMEGKISSQERDYQMLVLEKELEGIIEQSRLKTAHEDASALAAQEECRKKLSEFDKECAAFEKKLQWEERPQIKKELLKKKCAEFKGRYDSWKEDLEKRRTINS